jgi:hypothetical protein
MEAILEAFLNPPLPTFRGLSGAGKSDLGMVRSYQQHKPGFKLKQGAEGGR